MSNNIIKKGLSLKKSFYEEYLTLILFILMVMLATGLFNVNSGGKWLGNIVLYDFGFFLFATGMVCGMNDYKDSKDKGIYSIIFSYIFDLVGFILMICTLMKCGNMPIILSDLTKNVNLFLYFLGVLIFAISIYLFFYNKSDTLRNKKGSILIAFLVPTIILLLLGIFPYIVSYL